MKLKNVKKLHTLTPLILGITLAIFAVNAADPQLEDENLLQTLPDGYKVGNRQTANHATLIEMVPSNETVDSWTRIVTTQIYHGVDDPAFYASYRKQIEDRFEQACGLSNSKSFSKPGAVENGYPVYLWLATCQYKDPKQAPEITFFKFIQGNDAAYVVQIATHYEPSEEQLTESMRYLASVTVCDTRRKESPCTMPGRSLQDSPQGKKKR